MKKQNFPRLGIIFNLILFTSFFTVNAQSFIGQTLDGYAGVHGILLNPAEIVNAPFRADINLVSASSLAGSDYFGIDINDVINSDGEFNFDSDVKKFPNNDNNFFFNADALGPSVMFNINENSSMAITTRGRGFMNIHNVNGELYESLEDGFDEAEDFTFAMEDFNGTVHAWGEIGLTYGRILLKDEKRLLQAGATLKYLQGVGSIYFSAPTINGQYTASDGIISSTGNMEYGVSQDDFDTDNIKYEGLTSGIGFDIGGVYQWNATDQDIDEQVASHNFVPYKLKVGLSITDIGAIKYKQGEKTDYNLNQSVNRTEFDAKDFQDALEDNYDGSTQNADVKISLPSSLNLTADYRIKPKFYASLVTSFSLNAEDKATANNAINMLFISPRFQTKWLSVYSPIGVRQHSGFAWGFGFRLGPLTIGSGSVISNLISDSSKSTDVHVGLKVPLYRRLVPKI